MCFSKMASPHFFYLLCFLSIITFTSSTSDTIVVPLSPLFTKHPSSDPFHTLKLIASASLNRAHHLKHHKSHLNSSSSFVKTQVHPKSYGGYSINLNFGTPPQTFPFVLDTGSSLVWLPCSSHYLCSKCNTFPTKIPTFIPKNSSSSKFIGCKNPKCTWLFGPNVQSHCQDSQTCPAYTIQYGLGSTSGFLLSENLNFPGKIVPDFLVGCSIMSIYQPAGIAGFGRGPESVPSQMGLKRFSYCLVSHRFDDSPESSDLVLNGGKTNGVSYTPFQKNPSSENPAFSTYYYLTLRKILVGEKRVRIPSRSLKPDSVNGNGGSIVDSGSTFTFMERPVFDLVAQEFEKQVNYTRARHVEEQSGLSPCFNVHGMETASFPELTFQFRGGAKMTLPQTNYFSLLGKSDVACLTIVTDDVVGSAFAVGPAIILGNYQQQNYYVEYDLENQKFGFRSQNCK
ncbi:probable aspartyl protease At4g16563 [Gastrolobium bilobum]|uniref:probable aspartyl protease At4g16563 n=1 Tax=Gastrolobium bilobum TaxID=150636 RepID=UPI002AB3057A|nr:probable aspartyl protease At4g16563 [Gastrolobium bilobum]